MNLTLRDKIRKIKLLILDVDGVMTNGEIVVDSKGQETKIFNVQDGFGIVLFQRAGHKTAIISARRAGAVSARAKDLNIDKVYQDASPKIRAYGHLLKAMRLKDENACFIGDDLPDIEVLKRVGFSVSVPNAASEVRKLADYVTRREGGQGAVREAVELVLKTQGKWAGVLRKYGV